MSFRRTTTVAFLLALLALVSLSMLAGCESKPDAPAFSNPFDPDGPSDGDPFELMATLGDTNITLVWKNLSGYDLASYEVLHSLNFFGEFFTIGTVEAGDLPVVTFNYSDPDPTANHYFIIQAQNTAGEFTMTSHVVPTLVATPARVVINDGSSNVESRHINIRMNVTSGDSLRINQSGHPDSEVVLAADESGAPVFYPWDLGSTLGNDTTLTINVVVQNGSVLGDTNKVDLEVDFSPALSLSQGGSRVAQLFPLLAIETEGLVSMRFADSLENLENQPWIEGASTYSGYELIDSANPQTIHAEFLGDFGFSYFTQFEVTPDLLTDASFQLVLPPDHISDAGTVMADCSANATLMRFNESLDFSVIPWIAYNDTATIVLSPEAGEKTIYAQYRNDFADSPILTDYVIHLLQPVEVAITAPAEGDIVWGGGVIRVQGTATAPSAIAPVDSVMFDGGEGFVDVQGTDNWSYVWEVPRFEVDTSLSIRARAWSGQEYVTTVTNVLVSQILVGINNPAEGDTLLSDTDVQISGFAFPATNGAALDSITVEIDDVVGIADGTGTWTFDWHTNVVAEITEMVIEATAHAGTSSHTASRTVLIKP